MAGNLENVSIIGVRHEVDGIGLFGVKALMG